jgi:hypothetical protein
MPRPRRLATDTVLTGAAAAAIRLTIDAPSPLTGTGSALVLDGQDVAMIRAQLLDAAGSPVNPQDASAGMNVTFAVTAGGGKILATHNGSPYSEVDSTGPVFPAHHGVVRAFVQSTEIRTGSARDRELLLSIHGQDMGRDGTSKLAGAGGDCDTAPAPASITVRATVDGLPPAQIDIPVTCDLALLPLAVAAST